MNRISIGSMQLHVVEQGRGLPLLLVHGFPLDGSMWRGQLDGLSDGCRVLAPDLRGFGRSDVRDGVATMEGYADDLAALLDALQITQPVTLCGLSMGGYIAWQFWRRYPGRLAGLILCDTRAAADTEEAARGRHENAERVLREGPLPLVQGMLPKLFAECSQRLRPEIVAATRQVMLDTDPRGIAAALRGMAARPDVTPDLPKVQVPALLLGGQHDVITPPDEMRGIAEALPQARFVEIPDAGHMAPLEQPDAVNEAIRGFLRDVA